MSREDYTEQILVEAYRLGIYKEVLELADCMMKYKKVERYEALDRAFFQLGGNANKQYKIAG
jgi:hypothetical protein